MSLSLADELRKLKSVHDQQELSVACKKDDELFDELAKQLKIAARQGRLSTYYTISDDNNQLNNNAEFSAYLLSRFEHEGITVKIESRCLEEGKGPDGWDKTHRFYVLNYDPESITKK